MVAIALVDRRRPEATSAPPCCSSPCSSRSCTWRPAGRATSSAGSRCSSSGRGSCTSCSGTSRPRVDNWLDPFADPLGAGFQTIQALYAFARGGILGVGLGNGLPTIGGPAADPGDPHRLPARGARRGARPHRAARDPRAVPRGRRARPADRRRRPRRLPGAARRRPRARHRRPGVHHRRGQPQAHPAHRDHAAVHLVRRLVAARERGRRRPAARAVRPRARAAGRPRAARRRLPPLQAPGCRRERRRSRPAGIAPPRSTGATSSGPASAIAVAFALLAARRRLLAGRRGPAAVHRARQPRGDRDRPPRAPRPDRRSRRARGSRAASATATARRSASTATTRSATSSAMRRAGSGRPASSGRTTRSCSGCRGPARSGELLGKFATTPDRRWASSRRSTCGCSGPRSGAWARTRARSSCSTRRPGEILALASTPGLRRERPSRTRTRRARRSRGCSTTPAAAAAPGDARPLRAGLGVQDRDRRSRGSTAGAITPVDHVPGAARGGGERASSSTASGSATATTR